MTTTASPDQPVTTEHRTDPEPGAAGLPSSPAPRAPGSRLGPGDDFPEDLTGLGMAELQVLHSRITRQLDHDYLTDPVGPHSSTMDRCQELLTELDTRDTASPR